MSKVQGAIELAVTGGALATSFILPHEGAGGLQLCPWYHLTGVECPFCGMTRGFVAISHGDLPTAVELNEGSPLIYGAFVVLVFLISNHWTKKFSLAQSSSNLEHMVISS